jgi:hypothetical protein
LAHCAEAIANDPDVSPALIELAMSPWSGAWEKLDIINDCSTYRCTWSVSAFEIDSTLCGALSGWMSSSPCWLIAMMVPAVGGVRS